MAMDRVSSCCCSVSDSEAYFTPDSIRRLACCPLFLAYSIKCPLRPGTVENCRPKDPSGGTAKSSGMPCIMSCIEPTIAMNPIWRRVCSNTSRSSLLIPFKRTARACSSFSKSAKSGASLRKSLAHASSHEFDLASSVVWALSAEPASRRHRNAAQANAVVSVTIPPN